MKFTINGQHWEIKETNTKTLCDRFNGEEDEFLYGFCSYTENIIYLNETLTIDRKKHTLMHELAHCWTMESGWGFTEEVSRENLCNIISSIHSFITKITNQYFKKGGNDGKLGKNIKGRN